MIFSSVSKKHKSPPTLSQAVGAVTILWLVYTFLYSLQIGEGLSAVFNFLPGIAALAILMIAGFTSRECCLRVAPLSTLGAVLLGTVTLFLPLILLSGRWSGWNWTKVLLIAPASGISQELFFRAALLPALVWLHHGNAYLALFGQAALFSLWHLPNAMAAAPLEGILAVAAVTFICGLLWGWQVYRDRTVVWAMLHHALLLIVQSLYIW